MIDPKELRIGNLVQIKGQAFSILELSTNVAELLDKFYRTELYKNIDPIPLTEKWLLKIGLDRGEIIGHNDFNTLRFWRYSINADCHIEIEETKDHEYYFEVDGWGIELKYVHQLQNLYFALTWEELEINNDNTT